MTAPQQHRIVSSNNVRLHVVEQGTGPLVIFVHGFPESWYSWRQQLPAVAAAGFRAVAIDVRGYGRSSKPTPVDAYRMMALTGDVIGLVDALGETQATLVGHDWGAPIVWNSALLRPDLFRGVSGISVPYSPRGAVRPTDAFRAMAGDDEFYIEYFQQPGRAEAEIEKDVRRWLLGFYFSASGDAPATTRPMSAVSRGEELRARFQYPQSMPQWLSEADLDFYTSEFEHAGLTGGLNRYRNVDRDWADFAPFAARPIVVPAQFIGGDRDGPTMWGGAAIAAFPRTLPKLFNSTTIPGAGHWIQQEKAAATNALLLEFLRHVHR